MYELIRTVEAYLTYLLQNIAQVRTYCIQLEVFKQEQMHPVFITEKA